MLSVIVGFTGLFGFLVSFLLLRLGAVEMWLRYPVAVIAAYGVFLGLVRIWVELERMRFQSDDPDVLDALENPNRKTEWKNWIGDRDCSWLRWLGHGLEGGGEGCLVMLAIGLLFGVVFAVITVLLDAPALLAEVYLDAFLVSALYRRLRIASNEYWLGTAVKKTFWSVLIIAVCLSLAGWLLQFAAPGTHSIGPAIHKLWQGSK